MNLACIVLAAGEGSRMKSKIPKPLHEVAGRPLIDHVLDSVLELQPDRCVVVLGVGRQEVAAAIDDFEVTTAVQEEQLGTGHAVMAADDTLSDFDGDVLVTLVDVPLIRGETYQMLIEHHRQSDAAATMLTAVFENPAGYGRVVRDESDMVQAVVEERDADAQTRRINEINTGVLCFRSADLREALGHITNDNAQGQYYLPDTLRYLKSAGRRVAAVIADDPEEVMGINNRVQLARAESVMRDRVRRRLMLEGVTLIDPDSTFIDAEVSIGKDTVVWPGTHILGTTTIGEDCTIGGHVLITDCTIGDGCTLRHGSQIAGSRIDEGAEIGPFSNIRADSEIGPGAAVGSYCEVVRSTIGAHSKSRHFSYLGDSRIGEGVNIGAGTITCNYDGYTKHETVIGDGSFIGSDTILVAPVTLGKNSWTGAGSTITGDIPDDALGVARAKQRIIEEWTKRTQGRN
ncbi:MAG: bifunctional UDP-N-acetylglucosamine diphosphorylase/glucosamine-1-phosphate N-acetyltransferase GlmU [Armatimonadota bacterium]